MSGEEEEDKKVEVMRRGKEGPGEKSQFKIYDFFTFYNNKNRSLIVYF